MDEIQFSEPGDGLTDFEQRLLRECPGEGLIEGLGRRLVQELGEETGAAAFATVLDELATMKVHIPRRRHFFAGLWRRERDELVLSLSTRPDWTARDIADALGISTFAVYKVIRNAGLNSAGRQDSEIRGKWGQ